METKYKILTAGLVMALVYTGMLWAQQHPREGEVPRPALGGEAQRHPGPEEFEHAPRPEFEHRKSAEGIEKVHAKLAELKEAAQLAERQGHHDKAAKLHEKARKIAEKIEQHASKAKDRMPAEAQGRIEKLRDMARQAKERGEMEKAGQLWAEAEELERTLKREFERRPEGVQRPEPRRPIMPERPEGIRERPELPGPSEHFERMQRELKEALAMHLGRMVDEFRELQMRLERMERELQQLRAENMRLKSQLRERP